MTKPIIENFDGIIPLLRTLEQRPENPSMKGRNKSHTEDADFTKTKDYDEALFLLREGYTDILGEVKKKLNYKLKSPESQDCMNPPKNMVVGFIPNVPNAIQGLPDSMINIERKPIKNKTISIIYDMTGNCNEKSQDFVKAGIVLLQALALIERKGISTRLKVCFFQAEKNGQQVAATVKVKDYGQRFNLQKMTFPLAHPSMFRRIGFKWLETVPDELERGFRNGYGGSMDDEDIRRFMKKNSVRHKNEEEYVITYKKIKHNNFCAETILKDLKFID